MKLLAAIKNLLAILAVLVINSLSFAGHSAAMSPMTHEMGGVKHDSSNSASCATLCRIAVISKEEKVTDNNENEEDDTPTVPIYSSSQALRQDGKSVNQRLYAVEVKPPPKIPIYILYGAFRA